jgi:hypothetical protein
VRQNADPDFEPIRGVPEMKTTVAVLLVALVLAVQGTVVANPPQPLTRERAAELKQLILPKQGENPFWQVEWLNDIWQARQQAAAEGKPIFVWSGSEGAPITSC